MNFWGWIGLLIGIAIGFVVLYYVIKMAIREGMREHTLTSVTAVSLVTSNFHDARPKHDDPQNQS